MRIPDSGRHTLCSCMAAAMLAGCGASRPPSVLPGAMAWSSSPSASGSKYIKHVVVVIQENRSFDNFFSTFPNADGTSGGCMASEVRVVRRSPGSGTCPKGDKYVRLQEVNLVESCDPGRSYKNFVIDYDNGKMDGFGLEHGGTGECPGQLGTLDYQYVNPAQIAPYWTMAKRYVLADHTFQTQGSGSFTAHQDLIAGATIIDREKKKSLVDFPSELPWGCNADTGTKTSLLVYTRAKLKDEYHKGPFPCMTYVTLRDLLDARSVSWKYYSPKVRYPDGQLGTGAYWNAFDAIEAVRDGPEWSTNIAVPNMFFSDISAGTLAAVSWIVPDNSDSDHPGVPHDTGPSWVASIVNAVGQSSYWDSTAIIVVWDDWGGLYDHVPPPLSDHWAGSASVFR